MKNKIIVSILCLLMIGFYIQIVNASTAAPSPTCSIIANVLKIENVKYENWSVVKITLDILKISTVQADWEWIKCNNSYIKFFKNYGSRWVMRLQDSENQNPVYIGQKIQAKIHFAGDENWSSFSLSDIQVFEKNGKFVYNNFKKSVLSIFNSLYEKFDVNIKNTMKHLVSLWGNKELNFLYYIIPGITMILLGLYIIFKKKNKTPQQQE